MAKYKYTYQDWVEGKIESSSLLLKLRYLRELSVEDYEKIDALQLKAFKYLVESEILGMIDDFIYLYKDSFSKPFNLNRYIRETKKRIDEFIKDNPKVYMQTMNEYTGYIELTYQQTQLIFKLSIDETTLFAEGKALEIIKELEFLQWLLWFKDKEEGKAEKLYEQYYQKAITNTDDIIGRNKAISYKWLNNPDEELEELHQLLIENNLIEVSTTIEELKAVFEAKPLKEIKPIRWHDDNASELLYFIQQLEGTNGIFIEKGERANYKRLIACFVKPNGQTFTENFRQAKQNLKNYGLAPSKQQTIDNIIDQFY